MVLELNIGLNNNPKDVDGIVSFLNRKLWDSPITYKTVMGEYNGNEEPTLYIVYEVDSYLESVMVSICDTLTQESIAYRLDGVGGISYGSSYMGDGFEFNEKYFIS